MKVITSQPCVEGADYHAIGDVFEFASYSPAQRWPAHLQRVPDNAPPGGSYVVSEKSGVCRLIANGEAVLQWTAAAEPPRNAPWFAPALG